jgi:hypothetical protein
MAGRSTLKASDADRDRVADRLRQAATEGRLLTDELEQRLESAFSARTYAQLEALIADLPGKPLLRRARRHPVRLVAMGIIALLGVALVAVVLLQILIGVVAVWWLWALGAWFFFGRRRRRWGGCGPRRYEHRISRSYRLQTRRPPTYWA